MYLESGDVCDGNGITQYRGALSKDPAVHVSRVAELFAAIPRLTNAQIPTAVKRLRAGKPAIDEAAKKVDAYRAALAAGTVQPPDTAGQIARANREHMTVCRSFRCKRCNP